MTAGQVAELRNASIASNPSMAPPEHSGNVAALSASGLIKSFGATRALQGVTLDLIPGEVHALLGENGSGKSTFAKILAGIHAADAGVIRREGQKIDITGPVSARSVGIGIVFQELSIAPDLSVLDNLFLGREISTRFSGWLDRRAELAECEKILKLLGLEVDPSRTARSLSIAQKQMLEIAKALLQNPSVLIFDEPTASLTEREVDRLTAFIKDLSAQNVAILYVTHHLREVLRIADRVSVMRDGRIVAHRLVDQNTTEDELLALLTERRIASVRPRPKNAAQHRLQTVNVGTATCRNVSIYVQAGEIVGLYGVVGCGREEIGRSLVGLSNFAEGTVKLAGRPYHARSPAHALQQGIGYLPGDRKQDGIFPNRPIRENLTLSSLSDFASGGWLWARNERKAAVSRLDALRVKYASAEDLISTLSGGNQQKVILGRALAALPKLLVLEDPTAGIDVGAKYDLHEQIKICAESGMSFLWLSTDVTETLLLCHRVYAMYNGRIVAEIESPTLADEEQLLAAVLGGRGRETAA